MLEIERIKKKPSKLAQYKQSEQYLELVDAAIEANPLMYPVVREDLKTMELNLKAVKGNGLVLEYILHRRKFRTNVSVHISSIVLVIKLLIHYVFVHHISKD